MNPEQTVDRLLCGARVDSRPAAHDRRAADGDAPVMRLVSPL